LKIENSYAQIVRASSIIGSAHFIGYLSLLVRTKLVAVLLGPAGVGLIGLYTSISGLIGTCTSLGIPSSGVRQIASSIASSDEQEIAKAICVIRRLSWLTGIVGVLVCCSTASYISLWLLGAIDHTDALCLLGAAILINSLAAAEGAILQGARRIGDQARVQIAVALLLSIVSIALYATFGQRAIVTVILITAALPLIFNKWFTRRIALSKIIMTWRETRERAIRIIALGIAIMSSGLLTAGVDLITRSQITRALNIEAAGHYQAAWALSGIFAGFILSAMAADYYPRLTAIIHDRVSSVKLVNQQAEIGILLSLPGLLFTLAFGDLVINLIYTAKFAPAAILLPGLLFGVFLRVISWPLGYILLAKGASKWFLISEIASASIQVMLLFAMLDRIGLPATAIAFVLSNLASSVWTYALAKKMIGFSWSASARGLLKASFAMVLTCCASLILLSDWIAILFNTAIIFGSTLFCIRKLVAVIGEDNRLVRALLKFPGAKLLLSKI
jgi:PST family polysaccharide transporter